MRLGTSVLALAVAATVSTAAYAAITPQLVEVPISAAAKAADPTLANARSFDLRANTTADDAWASGDLVANTQNGASFYQAALGGNTANSTFWPIVAQNQYDTFVTAPKFGGAGGANTIVLGSSNPGGPTPVFTTSNLNVSWGNTNVTPGPYSGEDATVARITLLGLAPGATPIVITGANPAAFAHLVGKVGSTLTPTNSPTFDFSVVVPEPASAALMGLGLGAIALRRRTK